MNLFKWIADKWNQKFPPLPPKKYNVQKAKVSLQLRDGTKLVTSFTGSLMPGIGYGDVWIRDGESRAQYWVEENSKQGMFPVKGGYINRSEVVRINIEVEDHFEEH